MRYPGGKHRLGRRIAEYIESIRPKGMEYYEPFLGMASVFKNIKPPRHGSDIDCSVINMWLWGIKGWVAPYEITREQWWAAKGLPQCHPLRAFAGYQLSHGGKFFAAYANPSTPLVRQFAEIASRSLSQISSTMKIHELSIKPYWEVNPENAILYLDPPYPGAEKVYQFDSMNYHHFFLWASKLAKNNIVIVSGYSDSPYPSNFEAVRWFESKQGLTNKFIRPVTECLFKVHYPTVQQIQEISQWTLPERSSKSTFIEKSGGIGTPMAT